MAELFIGVDGGGTRCRVRIAEESGSVLGEAAGGPANIGLGRTAWENVLSACREAARAAGLGERDLARMHAGMGLAGVIGDAYRRRVEALAHPFRTLTVDSDAYAACLGAHDGRDGAVMILGTGSCGLAVVGERRHSIGGWGVDVSDEASGASLGREALRRALWAHDRVIAATPLTDELLARFGGRPENVVEWTRTATPADYASLVPHIFDHADDGDPVGTEILRAAARDAERMIGALRALGAARVSVVGGLAERLVAWLSPEVRRALVRPSRDALDGAILLARRRALAGAISW